MKTVTIPLPLSLIIAPEATGNTITPMESDMATRSTELIHDQKLTGKTTFAFGVSSANTPTRRDFMQMLGVAPIAINAALRVPANSQDEYKPASPASAHKPQIYTPYPSEQPWQEIGNFERYPLWPFGGDTQSFSALIPEWTAFYRSGSQAVIQTPFSREKGFYQIFVCRGKVTLDAALTGGSTKSYVPGDFFCRWMTVDEMSHLKSAPGTILLIKYQCKLAQPDYQAGEKLHTDNANFNLPFIFPRRDESGRRFDVKSRFLLGNALRNIADDRTIVTMLESFGDNTVAPSHYHPHPIWHEFVYIQGGQITPDGYYAPGGHLVSLPEIKEGPYLATLDPNREYPSEWPIYASAEAFSVPQNEPWPKIFRGKEDGIYGVLFVHYGPFAQITPTRLANWTTLKADELGPKG